MNNVIPFPSRTSAMNPRVATPVPLYRLSVTRAKALGTCPDAANETRKTRKTRALPTRPEVTSENGEWIDGDLAGQLTLSIRAVVESRTGSPASGCGS